MPAIKPPRLRQGDLVGIVSPSSAVRPLEKIERGVRYLESLGYRTIVGANAAKEHGFLSAPDEERTSDLNAMIRDERVRAIFATRGGYGSGRLLARVDYEALRRDPKIVVGFSDVTALQLAIYRRCKLVTFSGPLPAVEFWQDIDPYTEEHFWRTVTSGENVGKLLNPAETPLRCVRPGKAGGVLLGGNLSLVVSLFGTEYCPSFRNALLMLEDVSEVPYRVDRMLTHIFNASLPIRGAIFGKFTQCEAKSPQSFSVEHVLNDFAERMNVPAIAELQHGHVPRKLTIPMGLRARLDAEGGVVELLEPAVH